jgi:RNA polymerase sigma factor (sigma-70 family)
MQTNSIEIENLLDDAMTGNVSALEKLLKEAQRFVYRLTLRMLWNPTDAEDATQEILIRIIKNLKKFKKESKFTTWVYRITVNYLLTEKQKKYKLEQSYSKIIKKLETTSIKNDYEVNLQKEELKIGCSYAMLLSLDKNHRIAFILHYIFELSGEEGSLILEITPANYRKRVSRAKEKLLAFMSERCNLINDSKLCKCPNMLTHLVEKNFISREDTRKLRKEFGSQSVDHKILENLDTLERLAFIYKENANSSSAKKLHPKIKSFLKISN